METLTGGLNDLMWFSVIIANLLMYKEQSVCGIVFALENHNKESLKAPQEVIRSIYLVKDRFSYSYIIPKKYLSNLLIKFPLLMDFLGWSNLCSCFIAIGTESVSHPWIFWLQLKLIFLTVTILHEVNKSSQQLFKMLKTAFMSSLQNTLLYSSPYSLPFSDVWLVLPPFFRYPPIYP